MRDWLCVIGKCHSVQGPNRIIMHAHFSLTLATSVRRVWCNLDFKHTGFKTLDLSDFNAGNQKSTLVDRGRFSVVRASEFKSEDPGYNPLTGQGEGQFFYPSESTLVETCL